MTPSDKVRKHAYMHACMMAYCCEQERGFDVFGIENTQSGCEEL
jgi:hypothetical protein